MLKKITKLTDKQRARFPEYVKRWTAIGLSTEEAGWKQFEESVEECYRFSGLEPPSIVVRVQSPLVLSLAAPIAAYMIERNLKVKSGAVDGAVDEAVGGAVGGAVDEAVRGAVGGAVDEAVGGAVRWAVDEAVGGSWYRYIGGQFWISWQAYCAFFREVCNLEFDNDVWQIEEAYRKCQTSACWWWPHKYFVMVSNRPRTISLDTRGRLHSDSGKAIEFRDGWGLYRWHGIEVPEWLILRPQELSVPKILDEKNAEVRRAMIERYGQDRFVCDAKAKKLDKCGDNELVEIPLASDPERKMVALKLHCPSTGAVYVLRVPPTLSTVESALAWTFDVEKYQLEAET